MYKKILIIVLFSLLIHSLKAQISYCDTLLFPHHSIFKYTDIKVTKNYISEKYPNLLEHIQNRKHLVEIPMAENDGKELTFFSDFEKIIIDISVSEKDYLVQPDYFYPKENDEKFSIMILSDDVPFGITSEDKKVNYINRIVINKKVIPDSVYRDLLNPNILKTDMSIKPIEAYLSNCKKYIYLYIFGELIHKKEFAKAFDFSYMAKLIFTKEGQYIGRIVERGNILDEFGFSRCPDFMGF